MFAHDLHAYVRALMGSAALRVGPFTVLIDTADDGLFRNYAVPDDEAAPTAAEVSELVTAFVAGSRTPRLEFVPACAPQVEPALEAAGFVAERRLPVMTCDPAAIPPPAPIPGIHLGLARSRPELRAAAALQNVAYGVDGVTEHDVDRLAGTVEHGGLVGLATASDRDDVVGSGLCAPPHAGVSELAAVGVRPDHRRRGIAAAVTAHLTRACPDAGITRPFLTPAGEDEERIYRRVGYREEAVMVHISRPG